MEKITSDIPTFNVLHISEKSTTEDSGIFDSSSMCTGIKATFYTSKDKQIFYKNSPDIENSGEEAFIVSQETISTLCGYGDEASGSLEINLNSDPSSESILSSLQTERSHTEENAPKVVVQKLGVDLGDITILRVDEKYRSKTSINCHSLLDDSLPFCGTKSDIHSIYNEDEFEEAVDVDSNKRYFLNESRSPNYASKRFFRKYHDMNFHIRRGEGIKLRKIDNVASMIENASDQVLRFLHYVLFNIYGLSKNERSLSQTKQNILHFSGFPFDAESEAFHRKRVCLSGVPYPVLKSMNKIFLGDVPRSKSQIVDDLLQFFLKPTRSPVYVRPSVEEDLEKTLQEYERLKELALKGPTPIVVVPKLRDSFIQQIINRENSSRRLNSSNVDAPYFKPAYILNGPGSKLKSLPGVAKRVSRLRENTVSLLHNVLYGRSESDLLSRENILQFSGFLPCQKDFVASRNALLKSLNVSQLQSICRVFFLQRRSNRNRMIKSILEFLCLPSQSLMFERQVADVSENSLIMSRTFQRPKSERPKTSECNIKISKPVEMESCKKSESVKITECRIKVSKPVEVKNCKKTEIASTIETPSLKLRDFEKICSNIECATPDDLSELNDLLFVKPSENSEIHQKILDFSHFSFNENSIDYHYRKTLMHYMNYDIVRKIAGLLEIDNYENCTSQELASCIMKFLMEVKVPGKSRKHYVPKQCASSKNALFNVERSDVLNHTVKTSDVLNHNVKTSDVFSCKGIERLQCNDLSQHTRPRKAAVIHRLTKSSYSQIGIIRNNDALQNLDDDPDGDSVPLYEILHHPTDEELEKVILEIIKADLWSITMNGLIKKVFQQYSTLNLKYKTEFIKSKARQILLELRGKTCEFPVIM